MPTMAARVSSPVLIGRSEELVRLRAALAPGQGGQTRAILIAGEAGVGKTRLVAEFSQVARAEGALVLAGGCIDLGEGGLPFGPVVEALRGYVRNASEDELEAVLGQGRPELARLVPDLGPVPDESASGLSIGSAQGRLFELLLGMLRRLAARAPIAFVVEDLHWSDRSTRDLLGFLVRNLRDIRLTLILTYRSDELHRRHPLLPFLAELERTGHVERFELRRFDRREMAAQLRAIAGRALDPALIDSIHARSDGNAFFAEELLVAALEDGRTEMPPTLREVLLARVAALAEATQDFLRIASAAGQRVDPTLLAAATGMDEPALYEALRESVGRQVLVPDASAGEERYAFRHALLQEAIYDDLLPGERTRLHSAFARTLESSRSAGETSRVAELAYHWYAAHDLRRALEAAVAAGTAAEASYAFPEALAHYEHALELWDLVPDAESQAGRDRVELLASAASVARFHEPTRAVAHIRTALGFVDETVDPIRTGLLNERLGRSAWIAGQGELALEAHRTAVRLIPPEPPSEARARALAGLAQVLMLMVRFDESRRLADEAVALARSTGARQIEGHALNTRGVDRNLAGEVDAARDDLSEALRIAEEVRNVDDIGRAYANHVFVLDAAGRLEDAVEVANAGLVAAERLGLMRFFGTHLLCNAADLLYRLGRWDESERAARRAEEIGPLGVNEILDRELLGRLALARGRFEEAAEYLHRLRPLAEQAADVQFIAPVHASLAELALWQGRPAEAAELADVALRLIDAGLEMRIGELYALGVRANADVAELGRARRSSDEEAGAIRAAEELLGRIRARHAAVLETRPVFEPQSAAWLQLCEAEWSRPGGRSDADAWEASARAWEGLRRPYPAAYARWRQAEAILIARGDRARAAVALGAANETAVRLAAEPLRREVAALALRARVPLGEAGEPAGGAAGGPTDEGGGFGLTPREREVLALVAIGRTNRQIADELYISDKTAGVHVSNILGKLGVSGRGEAAALAYRLRLVDIVDQPVQPAASP